MINTNYKTYILFISLQIISSYAFANGSVEYLKSKALMKELEKEFDEIIEYHKNKGELHQRAESEVRTFVSYLLHQTEYTKDRLTEVIKNINYETIKPDKTYNVWPDLEFWRDMDDYGSSVALNFDGGVDMLENEKPVVMGRYDNLKAPSEAELLKASKAIKIDLKKYPISLHGYYEYRFNVTALFYAWIGYLWQEIEGYKCGIKVKTVQNNSIAIFSLNDYLDGDFSAFVESDYGKKPPRLDRFFPRKLSLTELYLRASQSGYPFNSFKNYWRYFEKGDDFFEIVTYEFSTGIRNGKKVDKNTVLLNQIIRHDNSREALKYITNFTNKMIFEGWEEKFRPLDLPKKMHENAFDYEIWTGIYWTEDQKNLISEQRVRNFEKKFELQLPSSFFHYLRLLNGRQNNNYNMFFPIDDLYTVHVKKFFNIEEIENLAKVSLQKVPQYLWIGESVNDEMLGLNINIASKDYEKIVIAKNGKIQPCDYTFEKFAKYAQSSPKQPEIYAAEENDAEFLKKRLNEGWDYTTNYNYQDAVTQAAENNSHEALEILLKAGARLRHNQHRTRKDLYDERTMDILDKYQKE